MKRHLSTTLTIAAALLATVAVRGHAQQATSSAASAAFDVSELDTAHDACTDFDAFVNSKWVKANPIPADKTRWGAFNELAEKSLNQQHELVEGAAAGADDASPGSIEQKIGWLYRSGMDTAAIERAGYDPIEAYLAEIAGLGSPSDLVAWLDRAYARGQGQLFRFGARADYKDARTQIGYASQGGLGLPTPDYYSKDEYAGLRKSYTAHIAKMLELTGVPAAEAKDRADRVLALESALASHSLSRVALRKPENQYHFVTLEQADAVTPHFDWKAFFAAQGVEPGRGFSLSQPGFFAGLDSLIANAPMETWRAYLAYHTIAGAAPYLSSPFQEEAFAFSGKTLNGQPEQSVRWKRVLGTVNRSMGMALGQLYVKRYFPPEARTRATELVANVRQALKARIENLDWMSDATKARALDKWEKFLPKIGYPEHWRDWSGLEISPDDYFGNVVAARKFNHEYNIRKIGRPTDRHEWGTTPQTVNAYYSPTENTINFPAAILQPPFFFPHGDDAVNYGAIGAVIGHESSHGFDDQGSQFDGNGNNENWWTKADRKKFEARADRLVRQFDGYVPLADHPDKHVNGKLTLGENIADLGGLNVAYDALQAALKDHPEEASSQIDGYTEDQRFFLAWARVWRGAIREKAQLVRLNVDPHSPARFRAIGAPSNMAAFAKAFGCRMGDPMVLSGDLKVEIW
ncbi:MAG TPA: M13 family metallopeptidase [Gemmatimonadota bacterium]|nr:M13 family metallopeptidase [Gemmatimonadota bacterium]